MAIAERVQRRDQMLDVAARLFSERGYHGTSMQHMAEALGMLRGSLYAHIQSKQDLLYEIVDRGADRFITRMEEVVASEAPPDEKLRRAIISHVQTVAEHMEASTVFLNDWRFLSPDLRDEIQAKRDLYEELVREIVEEGVEWGVFADDLDPQFATILVLSAVNWLYQWYDAEGPLEPEEIGARFADMLIQGFQGRQG